MLRHNLLFYGISMFYFVLALTLCEFRLVFVDPVLLDLYESKYSDLTGTYHYLPGKFEVFLVGAVFVPIWLFHFLYSMNLNNFFEENLNVENDENDLKPQLDPRLSGYRKKVVVVRTWTTLSYSKKILRNLIIFLPLFFLIVINISIQYLIAFIVNQKNFNLFNIAVNLGVMYFLIFHCAVFMPLMFKRTKTLLVGDYLWNPSCNFEIEYTVDLDMEELKTAVDTYDEKYLLQLQKGEDPNHPKEILDIENGGIHWKKNKIGNFTKIIDKNYLSDSENIEDDIDPRGGRSSRYESPFDVKYTTYEEDKSNLSDKVSHFTQSGSVITDNTNTSKVNLSKFSESDKQSKSLDKSGKINKRKNKDNVKENNDKLDKKEEIKRPSSEEFEKISPDRISEKNKEENSNKSSQDFEKISDEKNDNQKKEVRFEVKDSDDENDEINFEITRRKTEYKK